MIGQGAQQTGEVGGEECGGNSQLQQQGSKTKVVEGEEEEPPGIKPLTRVKFTGDRAGEGVLLPMLQGKSFLPKLP